MSALPIALKVVLTMAVLAVTAAVPTAGGSGRGPNQSMDKDFNVSSCAMTWCEPLQ